MGRNINRNLRHVSRRTAERSDFIFFFLFLFIFHMLYHLFSTPRIFTLPNIFFRPKPVLYYKKGLLKACYCTVVINVKQPVGTSQVRLCHQYQIGKNEFEKHAVY